MNLAAVFEQAIGLATSENGALAVLDRDGARVCVDAPHDLSPPARALAFWGDQLALLVGDEIRRLGEDGAVSIPPDARAIAFAMSGSLLVGFADRLVRLGDRALEVSLPDGFDVRSMTVDPGGYWLGGASSIVGYRPTANGVAVRAEWATTAPVHALSPGPDGAIYALAGADLLRNGEIKAQVNLVGLARCGKNLVGLRSDSLVDLNEFVPTPPSERPDIEFPPCES